MKMITKKQINKFLVAVGITVFLYTFTLLAQASDLNTDLVSCWSFDETSSPAVDDIGTNDLTWVNSPAHSATAKFGNSIDLERGSSQYLSITDASQTGLDTGSTGYSVGGWMQYESINTLFFTAFAKYQNTNQFSFQQRLWGYANQEGYVQTSANGSTVKGGTYNATNFSNWSTATWYHIMFVMDTPSGQSTMYVNGTAEITVSSLDTSLFDGTAAFTVGVGLLAGGEYFDGLMDEVVFYDAPISSTFVTELYNSGTGMSCDDIIATGGATRRIITQYSQFELLFPYLLWSRREDISNKARIS